MLSTHQAVLAHALRNAAAKAADCDPVLIGEVKPEREPS